MLPPRLPRILEIADQFLLLGIPTDDRQVCGPKGIFLRLKIRKLLLPLRMGATSLLLFAVDPQGVPQLAQQPRHRLRTAKLAPFPPPPPSNAPPSSAPLPPPPSLLPP